MKFLKALIARWCRPGMNRQGGFSLIELAVVMTAVAVIVSAAVVVVPNLFDDQRRTATEDKMDKVMMALSVYTQRNYRLPCPADADPANLALRGVERNGGNCFLNATDQALADATTGVVPWRTLGLREEDVVDSWGMYLTYKPAPHLTVNNFDVRQQGAALDAAGTAIAGAEIHNACRGQQWFTADGQFINRQKALFLCNAPPKDNYAVSDANVGADNWRSQAVTSSGAVAFQQVTGADTVVATNQWTDRYGAGNAGQFNTIADGGADLGMIRNAANAVTLISHGINGNFAFLRENVEDGDANPMRKLAGETASGLAPDMATDVASDETRNARPTLATSGAIYNPKTAGVNAGYDVLGLRIGASDDVVMSMRSDQLFALAGSSGGGGGTEPGCVGDNCGETNWCTVAGGNNAKCCNLASGSNPADPTCDVCPAPPASNATAFGHLSNQTACCQPGAHARGTPNSGQGDRGAGAATNANCNACTWQPATNVCCSTTSTQLGANPADASCDVCHYQPGSDICCSTTSTHPRRNPNHASCTGVCTLYPGDARCCSTTSTWLFADPNHSSCPVCTFQPNTPVCCSTASTHVNKNPADASCNPCGSNPNSANCCSPSSTWPSGNPLHASCDVCSWQPGTFACCSGTHPLSNPGHASCTINWAYSAFSSCSVSCGTGTQTRTVGCWSNTAGVVIADSFCAARHGAAVLSQSCTIEPPYNWNQSGWSACSPSCSAPSAGTQTQTVTCRNCWGGVVADGFCSGTKPATSQNCTGTACANCSLAGINTAFGNNSASPFFEFGTVSHGQSCPSQTRYCGYDTDTDYDSGTFTFASCGCASNLQMISGTCQCAAGHTWNGSSCVLACIPNGQCAPGAAAADGLAPHPVCGCVNPDSDSNGLCGTQGCTVSSWSPAESTVCNGTGFTQTSNCSTTRPATGTKPLTADGLADNGCGCATTPNPNDDNTGLCGVQCNAGRTWNGSACAAAATTTCTLSSTPPLNPIIFTSDPGEPCSNYGIPPSSMCTGGAGQVSNYGDLEYLTGNSADASACVTTLTDSGGRCIIRGRRCAAPMGPCDFYHPINGTVVSLSPGDFRSFGDCNMYRCECDNTLNMVADPACTASAGSFGCGGTVWTYVGPTPMFGTVPMPGIDDTCGDVFQSPGQGQSPYPYVSCTPGASCTGNTKCHINPTPPCRTTSGWAGNNWVQGYDLYECQ